MPRDAGVEAGDRVIASPVRLHVRHRPNLHLQLVQRPPPATQRRPLPGRLGALLALVRRSARIAFRD